MVKIAYYRDPTKDPEISEHPTVGAYLISQFTTRDQLLDLRFFDTEMLGHEIDQSGGDFLDINEGTVVILHDSMIPRGPETWGYIIVAVIFAAAAILLAPEIPPMGNRDQQSGTNQLGQPTNEPRVNQRIDDIFGRVNKHTPPLWQVPYRIGVDNQETEVLLLCIGRGRYETYVDRIYDGNTRVKDIPNASFSIYGPGTYPGNGIPELQIGPDITEKIGVYRKSNDLNPSELVPPNDIELGSAAKWVLNANGTLRLSNAVELEKDLTTSIEIGDQLILNNTFFYTVVGTVDLYSNPGSPSSTLVTFDDLSLEDFSSVYEVTDITSDTITVRLDDQSVTIQGIWAQMLDFALVSTFYKVYNDVPTLLLTSSDVRLSNTTIWGETNSSTEPLDIETLYYSFTVGTLTNGLLGPFVLEEGATEVILNFVSEAGFYKLNKNTEVSIAGKIQVTIYETDIDGNLTGNSTPHEIDHNTNPVKVRDPVFTTARLVLPYQYQSIGAQRTTLRDKGENVSNADVITWRDIYTFEPIAPGNDFGDVTLAHVVIPSNSTSRLIKERRQNLDVTRKITQYLGNGQFGPAESYATDQFDQILIHMALDPYIGRLTLNDINAEGLQSIRQQMIDYFGSDEMCRFGHDFDTVKLTFQDMYVSVLQTVMCKPYVQYGVYDAFFERPQATSSMQVTCRNKDFKTETRNITGEQLNDGIELTYRNNASGIQEVMYIPQDRSAINPKRIEYPGCTSEIQAFRLASREYNKMKYRVFETSFEMDDFGRNIIPGKRIDSPDGTRFTVRPGASDGYRVFDGEVVEVNGLQVELSEPVTFTAGEDHYITFTKNNGDNMASVLCTRIDDYTVLLSTLPEEPIYDGYSKDRTKFTLVSEQLKESIALIPQTIESSVSSEGVETNKITSINYSPDYYKDDLELPL